MDTESLLRSACADGPPGPAAMNEAARRYRIGRAELTWALEFLGNDDLLLAIVYCEARGLAVKVCGDRHAWNLRRAEDFKARAIARIEAEIDDGPRSKGTVAVGTPVTR